MPLWDLDELLRCIRLYKGTTEASVMEAYLNWGGSARFVLAQQRPYSELRALVDTVNDIATLEAAAQASGVSAHTVHRLVVSLHIHYDF